MTFLLSEYGPVLVYLIARIVLACIILGLSSVLALQNPDVEKVSAYECGFDPFGDARATFDVRFYLVAILFILFDLEAAFIFPWCVSLSQITALGWWSMFDFVFELVIGFIYAWRVGALEWS
jgi:NADH-quinone oxidoreductase subunit A